VTVTAVVVAFHRPGSLAVLLAALQDPGLAVIVVNVECDESVAAVAREHGAVLVELAGNPGYATAVNLGVERAADGMVVFLNDDCRIEARDVLRLAAVVAADGSGRVDVAVPRVVDAEGVLERTIAAVPTPTSLAREWMLLPDTPVRSLAGTVRVEKWRAPDTPERIDAAAAVVLAARRALLRELPLPERYFLYWEESEWFWRLRERGAVVEYRPEITCVHVGGRDDVRPEKSRLLARNAVRCVRVTQGRTSGAVAWVVVVGWNLRLVVTDAVRRVVRPGARSQARLHARLVGLAAATASWRELR
jgi:N-acetylglucosaminyl-diphospho-decaprenol L-rhamnosyltransferase